MLNYRSKPSQDSIFIEIAIWGADLVLCSAPEFGPHPGGSYGGQGGLSFFVGAKGRQWSQISHRKLKISISHSMVIWLQEPDGMLKVREVFGIFRTFCSLSGTTTYPQLPHRRIDPLDPHFFVTAFWILDCPYRFQPLLSHTNKDSIEDNPASFCNLH